MEEENKELEDKLRTTAETMERQQLLDENNNLQRQLSLTEGHNRQLKANFQQATEEIGRGGQENRLSSPPTRKNIRCSCDFLESDEGTA